MPVGLVGTDEIQPVDSRMPRFGKRVTIRFGQAIDPGRIAGGADDRMALRALTDEVMYEIRELCGCYEYVDAYATKQAEDLPTDIATIAAA